MDGQQPILGMASEWINGGRKVAIATVIETWARHRNQWEVSC